MKPGDHYKWMHYESVGAGYPGHWTSHDVEIVRIGLKRVLVDVLDGFRHYQRWVSPEKLSQGEWFACTMDDPVGFFPTKRAVMEHLSAHALDGRKNKRVRMRTGRQKGERYTYYDYMPPTDGHYRTTWYFGRTNDMIAAGWRSMVERAKKEQNDE